MESPQTDMGSLLAHTHTPTHSCHPALKHIIDKDIYWIGKGEGREDGGAYLPTQEHQPGIWVKVRYQRGWGNVGSDF